MILLKDILNEIKIEKPTITWNFTKYIPNFNPEKIKVGDNIIYNHNQLDKVIEIIDNGDSDDGIFFVTDEETDDFPLSGFLESTLVDKNNKNNNIIKQYNG